MVIQRRLTRLLSSAALATLPALVLAGCGSDTAKSSPVATVAAAPDAANASYLIEGKPVTLAQGRAEAPAAPGSAAKAVTQLSGPTATGDVDGDGKADSVVILTTNAGGSGTFFYLAVVRSSTADPVKAVLLGDRVSVTGVSVAAGGITVELLDRPAGAPMAATPSVAASRSFALKAGELVAK